MRRDGEVERERDMRREKKRDIGKKRRIEKRALSRRKRERRHVKRCKMMDRRRIRLVNKRYGREAYNSCTSKKYYHTKKGAMRGVRYMEAVFHKRYTAYKCDYCDGWHLTTHGYGGENEAVRDPREIAIVGNQDTRNQCRDS